METTSQASVAFVTAVQSTTSEDNQPGKCRSCHGCTVDHKCDICSEWTDKVWTGIVKCTRTRSSQKRHSTPAMSTDSPSLLTEPGGSSKRPCSRGSRLSSGSFCGFSPSAERFQEDNQDSVMTEILHLLRHQQNPQPTVISPGSVNVLGTVNAIVLLVVTIAGAGFRCRALRPSVLLDVTAPMTMSKTCDINSAPIMSVSEGPAMTWPIDGAVRTNVPTAGSQAGGSGHAPSTPCEWNPAGGPAPAEHPEPEVNFLEYHVRHWAILGVQQLLPRTVVWWNALQGNVLVAPTFEASRGVVTAQSQI